MLPGDGPPAYLYWNRSVVNHLVDYSQSGETRNPYGFTFRLPRCFGEIMAHVTLSAFAAQLRRGTVVTCDSKGPCEHRPARPWAIRRQSDLDHLTITQVVNEAFRHYFERT